MASQKYIDLLRSMEQLHINKNAGYAGHNPDAWANFRTAEMFGVTALQGCLVRMSDKYIRASNLFQDSSLEKVGENIKDTLKDLASYALIAVCLLEESEHENCGTQERIEHGENTENRDSNGANIPDVVCSPV